MDCEDGYAIYDEELWDVCNTYEEAFERAKDWGMEADIWDYVKRIYWIFDDDVEDFVDSGIRIPDESNDVSRANIGTIVIEYA